MNNKINRGLVGQGKVKRRGYPGVHRVCTYGLIFLIIIMLFFHGLGPGQMHSAVM